jgi:hypothetical protein
MKDLVGILDTYGSAGQRRGGVDGSELPAGQAAMETLPGRRSGEAQAWECGAASNRRRPEKKRRKILWRVQDKYAGFGPLASEYLKSKDQLDAARWMLEEGLWKRARKGKPIASGGSVKRTSASWCRWTAASTTGIKAARRRPA